MASYFVVPFATILVDSGVAQSHAKACNRPTDPLTSASDGHCLACMKVQYQKWAIRTNIERVRTSKRWAGMLEVPSDRVSSSSANSQWYLF